MIPDDSRQPTTDAPIRRRALTPSRRFLLVIGLFVLTGFLGYSIYQSWSRNRIEEDKALASELQSATLIKTGESSQSSSDWPQWRGPRRDGISPETGLSFSWPESGPRMLWEAPASEGYSGFAVAGGRAFLILQEQDNEAVVCWDAATGEEKWRTRYPAHFTNMQGSGPRSTPTVDEGRVYMVGATGVFLCLDAESGRQYWRHDLLREFDASNLSWGVSFSPLIEGNLVLTHPGGSKGRSIVAFDKKTGDIVWTASASRASYSSPIAVTAAGHGQIIFFAGNGPVGIAPADGRVLWEYPYKNNSNVNAATPIAFSAKAGDTVNDYVFVSCNYDKGGLLLKLIPDGDGVAARRVYETRRMSNHFATCVLLGDQLYGFSEKLLVCMDVQTGEVRWQQRGFDKGSLTVADGKLVILGEFGRLAVAEPTPDEYREIASFQFSENKCWTVPVVANGRLYLRDEHKIACYDLKK
jgi:outer membrane protein assembly factor BamB